MLWMNFFQDVSMAEDNLLIRDIYLSDQLLGRKVLETDVAQVCICEVTCHVANTCCSAVLSVPLYKILFPLTTEVVLAEI